MIERVKGRYRSVSERNEKINIELNKYESELLEKVLAGDKSILKAIYSEYDEIPVSPEEFFSSEYYIGSTAKVLRPKLKEDLIEIFSGNYYEIIFGGAVRYGKTTVGHLIMMRVLYELLCLHNPAEYFGLDPSDSIKLVNISVTIDLALSTLFEGLVNKLRTSPYFQKVRYVEYVDCLKFPKNIEVSGGESSDTGILGRNIVCAIMDEANFYSKEGVVKKVGVYRDKAESLYKGVSRRISTTFLKDGKRFGKCVLLSSKRDPDDFVERRIEEVKYIDEVFVREYSLYDVDPSYKDMKTFKVFIGGDGLQAKIIESPAEEEQYDKEKIEEVPEVFYDDYVTDLVGALRDISGIGISGAQLFFTRQDKVKQSFINNRPVPFSGIFYANKSDLNWDVLVERNVVAGMPMWKPKNYPELIRYVSIDFGLKNDCTGLAMGCIPEYMQMNYSNDKQSFNIKLPKIYVDLMLAIKSESGELEFAFIRNFIYRLILMGFKIRFVACDSYQSFDTLQQLRAHGIESEVVSVDKTMMPYELLKNCIYDGRLVGYNYDVVIRELLNLQLLKNKVDHKPKESKDVADALASLVYCLTEKKVEEYQYSAMILTGADNNSSVPYVFGGEEKEVGYENDFVSPIIVGG